MTDRILILGGTREASVLADELVQAGHDVTTSLAGRTREPAPVSGKLRMGGFGGAQGLAAFLATENFDRLIDATHPFAKQISANAKLAAKSIGIALEIRGRPPWIRQTGDQWIEVKSLEQAKNAITKDSRVLLALGSQHIEIFASRSDVHFIVRMVDPPAQPLPLPDHEIVIGRPGDLQAEKSLLQSKRINLIVCRNSGGLGAYAKIEAARELRLPVIMIGQPENI